MTARRKNSLTHQVRRAYRQNELASILTLPETEFGAAFGMTTTEVDQQPWRWDSKRGTGKPGKPVPNDYYHFRDNGARVLAVAHLDTVVQPKGREPRFYATQNGPGVISGALDDRLGAYVILKLLPSLGVTHDWLLTVGEEDGQSTADFFTAKKEYDWVIEFDRAGTDVVMYQYDDYATRKTVRECGAPVGNGSFSDICYLEQLGIKGFNWGVGYGGNYHSEKGYAVLADTFSMVAKYLRFHAQNVGITMPHEPYENVGRRRYSSDTSGMDCDLCQSRGTVDYGTMVCEYCRSCFNCGKDELACSCLIAMEAAIASDDAEYDRWLAERAARTVISGSSPTSSTGVAGWGAIYSDDVYRETPIKTELALAEAESAELVRRVDLMEVRDRQNATGA